MNTTGTRIGAKAEWFTGAIVNSGYYVRDYDKRPPEFRGSAVLQEGRLKLLDLYCGAGGAAYGYHQAGFEVVGVDILPQKRYPFPFIQADALAFLDDGGWKGFDAIHASPPCQGYSRLRHLPWLRDREYPLLIEPTRDLLRATGLPYVIECVEDAPLTGVLLCGRMFGLPIYRHRRFESNVFMLAPGHVGHDMVIGHGRMVNDRRKGTLNAGSSKGAWGNQKIITVAGGQFRKADGERALQIDWMTKASLCQAIPPAYTKFMGECLLRGLGQPSQP